MESFHKSMYEYKEQLKKGSIQNAYRGLMEYIMNLRTYFKNKYPEYRVVSVSHSCILTPPSDPLHGMNGLYKSCSHLKNRRLFNQCKEDPAISLGATNKKTIKRYGLVRKLSFNPGFVDLIDRLDIFIEGIR